MRGVVNMREDITIKQTKEMKTKAENYIAEIIKKLESETGCVCQDIGMFVDDDDEKGNSLEIDINLRIPIRMFNEK